MLAPSQVRQSSAECEAATVVWSEPSAGAVALMVCVQLEGGAPMPPVDVAAAAAATATYRASSNHGRQYPSGGLGCTSVLSSGGNPAVGFTATGLHEGRAYELRVAALTQGVGWSAWGETHTVRPLPLTAPPHAPAALRSIDLEQAECTSVEVEVPSIEAIGGAAATDARGGAADVATRMIGGGGGLPLSAGCGKAEALSVEIARLGGSGGGAAEPTGSRWATVAPPGVARRVEVQGLETFVAYTLRLRAHNDLHASPPAPPSPPFVAGIDPQAALRAPIARPLSSASFELTFDAFEDTAECAAAAGLPVLRWEVLVSLEGGGGGGGEWQQAAAAAVAQRGAVVLPSLRCATGCRFKVKPIVDGYTLYSSPSATVLSLRLPRAEPGAVRLEMRLRGGEQVDRDAFASDVARALDAYAEQVEVAEVRCHDGACYVVFDLIALDDDDNVDGGGGASEGDAAASQRLAQQLLKQLAPQHTAAAAAAAASGSSAASAEEADEDDHASSALLEGDVTWRADASAGLLKLHTDGSVSRVLLHSHHTVPLGHSTAKTRGSSSGSSSSGLGAEVDTGERDGGGDEGQINVVKVAMWLAVSLSAGCLTIVALGLAVYRAVRGRKASGQASGTPERAAKRRPKGARFRKLQTGGGGTATPLGDADEYGDVYGDDFYGEGRASQWSKDVPTSSSSSGLPPDVERARDLYVNFVQSQATNDDSAFDAACSGRASNTPGSSQARIRYEDMEVL